MPDEPRIEQFRLADLDALFDFLRLAYPDEPRKFDPDYWNWHYLEHPLIKNDDIPLWVVWSGERIVGQVATIPVEVKAGTARFRAIWILDFVVLGEIRGKGFGKKLMAAAGAAYPVMTALGFNEMSEAVLRKTGWANVGAADRYHALLAPGTALKEIRDVAPLRSVVNAIYMPLRPRGEVGPNIRPLNAFGPEFDELWARAAPQWPCAVVRSSEYLRWQFEKQPKKRFEILGCYRDDRLDGYAVLFFRRDRKTGLSPKAAISDICYASDRSRETVDALVSAALSRSISEGTGGLVTDVRDPMIASSLSAHGFHRVKTGPRFMVYTPEMTELMYDEANWFLTRADSDVSIFEEANQW